tara:strand:- start:1484 stop:2368 length:885 start_codon:yes stop_codon:yes gene_type:complete
MKALVDACDIEICWHMLAASDEEKERSPVGSKAAVYLTDVYIGSQECDAVNADTFPNTVNEVCEQLINEGIDPSRLIGHGHSHVNMCVQPSGKDEDNWEVLELEPLIAVIMNKKGDIYVRMDTFEDPKIPGSFRHSYICSYEVESIQMIPDDWGENMVDEHVTIIKKAPVKTGWSGNYNWANYPRTVVSKPKSEAVEVEVEIREELNLPKKLSLLQEVYDSGDATLQEVVDYLTAFASQTMSVLEIEEDIEAMFGHTLSKESKESGFLEMTPLSNSNDDDDLMNDVWRDFRGVS